MLTERIKQELLHSEPALRERAGEITVIPCCVDMRRFALDAEARAAYRATRGWADKRVLVYAGKLGSWYLSDELAHFFAVARQHEPRFFLQVLTQSDPAPLRQALQKYDVQADAYDIRFAPPEQLPLMLAASDAGLCFIRACYSKLASSPTKNGEYLAAGLPIVASAGIGDGDQMLPANQLGVLLREFSETEYQRAAEELCALLDDGGLAERCREFAERELSLGLVGGPRYAAVYEQMFAPEMRELVMAEDKSA